jgi:hypothetical protein
MSGTPSIRGIKGRDFQQPVRPQAGLPPVTSLRGRSTHTRDRSARKPPEQLRLESLALRPSGHLVRGSSGPEVERFSCPPRTSHPSTLVTAVPCRKPLPEPECVFHVGATGLHQSAQLSLPKPLNDTRGAPVPGACGIFQFSDLEGLKPIPAVREGASDSAAISEPLGTKGLDLEERALTTPDALKRPDPLVGVFQNVAQRECLPEQARLPEPCWLEKRWCYTGNARDPIPCYCWSKIPPP